MKLDQRCIPMQYPDLVRLVADGLEGGGTELACLKILQKVTMTDFILDVGLTLKRRSLAQHEKA